MPDTRSNTGHRIVILITFFIYIRAGREIYKKHKQLRDFSYSHHEPEPMPPMDDPFSSSKTTEVVVTSESRDKAHIDLTAPMGSGMRRGSEAASAPKPPSAAAYSVTIQSGRRGSGRESAGDVVLPIQTNVSADTPPHVSRPANPHRRRAAYEANNATWSYTKCAILFFTAMLVTWIPSSANRLFSLIHTNSSSLTLEYMSAFVLPLQGFWNAIIYMVTSWKACKMLWNDMFRGGRHQKQETIVGRSFQMISSGRNGSKSSAKTYESESMTDLAGSRPSTNERDFGQKLRG